MIKISYIKSWNLYEKQQRYIAAFHFKDKNDTYQDLDFPSVFIGWEREIHLLYNVEIHKWNQLNSIHSLVIKTTYSYIKNQEETTNLRSRS